MVDFRYHALSLVAVFLALGIGIVLGVTIGDSLVSDADKNLRESLRDDVTEARQIARDERELGAKREQVIAETVPELAAGRLRGRRVGLVAFGELPGEVEDAVEEAIDLGGGELTREAVLGPPDDTRRLLRLAGGPLVRRKAGRRARGPELQARLAARIGRLLLRGGRGARPLWSRFPRRFAGDWAGRLDVVVVYRHPPAEPEGEEEARRLELRKTFEDGLFEGLRDNVVGVETLESDPSQVEWLESQALASMDNVDVPAGQLGLVLLAQQAVAAERRGRPEGTFGYKDSADDELPDVLLDVSAR